MFLVFNTITNQPIYVTGVEEIAEKYCQENNERGAGRVETLDYTEVAALGGMNINCHDLSELVQATPACEINEAWPTEITPEQKHHILTTLGFQGRGKGVWWHKAMGPDVPANRYHFNIGTENLNTIPFYLTIRGAENFRVQVKELMNL